MELRFPSGATRDHRNHIRTMKTFRPILTGLLALGLLACTTAGRAATLANADTATAPAGKAAPAARKGAKKDLNLTAEQKQKLKAVQQEQQEKMTALRAEFEKKLAEFLTPEQLAKFKETNARRPGSAPNDPTTDNTTKPKRKAARAK
jgi:Spy/CpxP family protein refolding chaperone